MDFFQRIGQDVGFHKGIKNEPVPKHIFNTFKHLFYYVRSCILTKLSICAQK